MSNVQTFLKTNFPTTMYWLGKKRCILSTFFYRSNPQKWTLKRYRKKYKVNLNLENPKTFFDKINFIKHYYFDSKETLLSDKYGVKQYLTDNGDGDIVPKALFFTDDVRELEKWISNNKDSIKRFVIKTNHSCGDIFIYNNGVITRKYGIKIKSLKAVYRMLKIAMKYNHYYTCFESNYRYIKPLIFVEEYIEMENATEYEFMTNYGQIKFVNIVTNRQSKSKEEILYDSCWKRIGNSEATIEEPKKFDYMKSFIKRHVSQFPFCRVDFIQSDSKLYFCEFTFIKSGGIGSFGSEELNNITGDLIDISNILNKDAKQI